MAPTPEDVADVPARDDTDLELFAETLAKGARLLGVDLGDKTIGLALSDVERTIATPLETIRRTKFTRDAERLRAHVAQLGVGAGVDRKSTRLNSSHANISYAVFCLKIKDTNYYT